MTRTGLLVLALAAATLPWLTSNVASGQQQKGAAYKAPRNPVDGKADLSGIWEARNTAYANLEAHDAGAGIRAGVSMIVDPADGKIPYKPEARAKQVANFKNRLKLDPMNKCYTPGVPRVMYIPYPFQIFQTPKQVQILSEFEHTTRNVYSTTKKATSPKAKSNSGSAIRARSGKATRWSLTARTSTPIRGLTCPAIITAAIGP